MSAYIIFGKKVPSYVLSLGTLTTLGFATTYFMNKGGKEETVKQQMPDDKSSSDDLDVEKLINNFLKDNDKSDESK